MVEIVVFFVNVGFGEFDWWVSMVMVVRDGFFLIFEGVDCMLIIFFGVGMVFGIVGKLVVYVILLSILFVFVVDVLVEVIFIDGLIIDFNVMIWCGCYGYWVEWLIIEGYYIFLFIGEDSILFVCDYGLSVVWNGQFVDLVFQDVILLEDEVVIMLCGYGIVIVISFVWL